MLGIVYQVHKFSRDSTAAFSFTSSFLKNILDEELARLVAAPDQRARGGVEEAKLLADRLPGCKLGGRHVLLHLAKRLSQESDASKIMFKICFGDIYCTKFVERCEICALWTLRCRLVGCMY